MGRRRAGHSRGDRRPLWDAHRCVPRRALREGIPVVVAAGRGVEQARPPAREAVAHRRAGAVFQEPPQRLPAGRWSCGGRCSRALSLGYVVFRSPHRVQSACSEDQSECKGRECSRKARKTMTTRSSSRGNWGAVLRRPSLVARPPSSHQHLNLVRRTDRVGKCISRILDLRKSTNSKVPTSLLLVKLNPVSPSHQ